MNVKYIHPFIEATANCFHELFGFKPEVGNPYLIKKDDPHDWEISGVIGIAGQARGVVVLSFEAVLARKLASQLTGKTKASIDEDVIDTVGEIVNIIAGNAKKGLEEFKLMISLPSIVQGQKHQVGWPTNSIPIIGVPFSTPEGDFNLAVGLENIIII